MAPVELVGGEAARFAGDLAGHPGDRLEREGRGFVGPGGIGRNPTQRGQTEAPGFSHQWTSGTRDTQTFTQPWFDNGEWVKLEMYINLRPGEERVRAWMNDVLVLDGVPDWGGSTPPIGELKLGSTLGGGSGLPTLDVRYYADYALVETYGR